jgi:hypothetical protein
MFEDKCYFVEFFDRNDMKTVDREMDKRLDCLRRDVPDGSAVVVEEEELEVVGDKLVNGAESLSSSVYYVPLRHVVIVSEENSHDDLTRVVIMKADSPRAVATFVVAVVANDDAADADWLLM